MAFSPAFSTPIHGFIHTKTTNPSWVSSSSSPSMAFPVPSCKISYGSSKSAFFQHGFSSQSLNFHGFASKSRPSSVGVYARAAMEKTIHDFNVKDIDGNDVSLSKFKGKVLLIVNVASKCHLEVSWHSCDMTLDIQWPDIIKLL